jgi:hypothetical protein
MGAEEGAVRTAAAAVQLVGLFIVKDGLLVLLCLHVHIGAPQQHLEKVRLQIQCARAVLNGIAVLPQLQEAAPVPKTECVYE